MTIRGEPGSLDHLLNANDWEEGFLRDEGLVSEFALAFLMASDKLDLILDIVDKTIVQLHDEEFEFPAFVDKTLRFSAENETDEKGEENIPRLLTYCDRMSHLLSKEEQLNKLFNREREAKNDDPEKNFIEWLKDWNDEIREKRKFLLLLQDQKTDDYLDPEFETLNADLYRCRTVIQDFPTLVLFMYDLLPRSWSDESSLESITKPKKWKTKKLTDEEEAEFLLEREKAFLIHRAIIFSTVVKENFVLFPRVVKYLQTQKAKYCRPGVNYYMHKEDRDLIEARFREAWRMLVHKPIPLGKKTRSLDVPETTALDRETQRYQRRNRVQTVKDALTNLRIAGCDVDIPVIDVEQSTTENRETDEVSEGREDRNLELLAKHYTRKPDVTDEFPIGKYDIA
jgi:hypothetical protein